MNTIKFQGGAATIILAFTLVGLLGASLLALEGTRYLQTKTRLGDAAEAAVLGLATARTENTLQERQLASDYLSSYLKDEIRVNDLEIVTTSSSVTFSTLGQSAPVLTYKVRAKTLHNSWWSDDELLTFDARQLVANSAVAETALTKTSETIDSIPADIVLVTDMSNSMNFGAPQRRVTVLKETLHSIVDEMLSTDNQSLNRIGLVPFNMRVYESHSGSYGCTSNLRYKSTLELGLSPNDYADYEDVDWNYWMGQSKYLFSQCLIGRRDCSNNIDLQRQARTFDYVLGRSKQPTYKDSYPDPHEVVDVTKTINSMFQYPADSLLFDSLKMRKGSGSIYYPDICRSAHARDKFGNLGGVFRTVPLTNNQASLTEEISKMTAIGGTAMYQGLISGARLLANAPSTGAQRAKIMLMISDGRDEPYNTIIHLIESGMCEVIREKIPNIYMGLIGVQFRLVQDQYDALKKCLGEENIVTNVGQDQVLDQVRKMISKGIITSETSSGAKLHYRFK
ncbi:hypothetical protein [Vibrio nomapromontoriensis]|uniref:hypothetical protein n=1 Tax=Vibrio nomapromontoriensis TaxID=2910246 RepID=UPI003D10EAE8